MSVPIRPTPKMRRPSADVRAQKADLDQLDRFRKSAENWRNGLTGLTALLGVATAIRAGHDVHLPQLHGAVALPAPELVAPLLATPQLDEVVALEASIDARADAI